MLEKLFSIATTALIVTGVGIALRPGAPTAKVVEAGLSGLAKVQTAAYGPTGS